jgi:hypothetical protein
MKEETQQQFGKNSDPIHTTRRPMTHIKASKATKQI